MNERVRAWVPSSVAGLVVLALGLLEAGASRAVPGPGGIRSDQVLLVLGTASAVTLCRRAPAVALAVAGVVGLLQVLTSTQILLVEVAFFAVVFAAARWGDAATVAAAALAVPSAAAAIVFLVAEQRSLPLLSFVDSASLFATVYRFGDTWRVGAGVIAAIVLAVPWLAGLALRFADRARASRASQAEAEERAARARVETAQAQEIARLRDEQSRLARDVHDVVGHSLAVILAQAESAQFLPDDDPEALKRTMATIAGSARSSLQDVRQVLSAPDDAVSPARPLDTLVDNVRAGGHEVVVRELGVARPLPPELEVTAYRVLQEMLTNAVKHGRRDEPVFVERHWPDDTLADELRLEVRNAVGERAADGDHGAGGTGLDGMRQRLAAVGGRLDARRRDEPGGDTFTVTAWLPVAHR